MKELVEIERDYIKDIIEFFCRKSIEIFIVGITFNKCDIEKWIERHIRKRLFESNLITDYRIVVNFYDIVEIRDNKIDNLLGKFSIIPKNIIKVSVRYGNRNFETFEYEITT